MATFGGRNKHYKRHLFFSQQIQYLTPEIREWDSFYGNAGQPSWTLTLSVTVYIKFLNHCSEFFFTHILLQLSGHPSQVSQTYPSWKNTTQHNTSALQMFNIILQWNPNMDKIYQWDRRKCQLLKCPYFRCGKYNCSSERKGVIFSGVSLERGSTVEWMQHIIMANKHEWKIINQRFKQI